jgi:hypothetical protein
MSISKKIYLYRDFATGVICMRLRLRTPYKYTTIPLPIFFTLGRGKRGGGEVEPERRFQGQ